LGQVLDLAQYAAPTPWHDGEVELQFGTMIAAAQHNQTRLWGIYG
jgi:hypothetical protein